MQESLLEEMRPFNFAVVIVIPVLYPPHLAEMLKRLSLCGIQILLTGVLLTSMAKQVHTLLLQIYMVMLREPNLVL